MITEIESSSNLLFKNTKKLLNASDRKKSKKFIVEGYRIVADAVRHNADIEYIVISDDYNNQTFEEKYKVYRFGKKLFSQISDTVNSQGIIAVVNCFEREISSLDENFGSIVYLDCVADPGNMGTILRTCDAMGVDAVIASKGCVDIYNPKVVRATMASMFSIPIFCDVDESAVLSLKQKGFCVVGTVLDGSVSVFDSNLKQKTVIVMGNEANGISDKVKQMCDLKIKIPMSGGAESLNVAVCCAMILYEKSRQNYTQTDGFN